MFPIINIHIDKNIATKNFVCDLNECKGGCCTSPGGRGAPLLDSEVELIKSSIDSTLDFLPELNKKIIFGAGAIEGSRGNYATRCVNKRDCVFVYYDEFKVAKCSIEKAFFDGKTNFRKPISCHLFPIRIEKTLSGTTFRFEEIDECNAAIKLGEKLQVPLFEYLKDALIRGYGEEFYHEFKKSCENLKK